MMLFLYEIRKLDKVCLSMLLLLLPDGSRGRGRGRIRSRSLLLGNVSSWNWEILKQPVWVEFRTKIKRWRQSCCGYLAKSCNSNLKLWFGSILLAKRNFLFSSLLLLFYWLPELNWTQLWIVIEARAISSGWILQSSKLTFCDFLSNSKWFCPESGIESPRIVSRNSFCSQNRATSSCSMSHEALTNSNEWMKVPRVDFVSVYCSMLAKDKKIESSRQ